MAYNSYFSVTSCKYESWNIWKYFLHWILYFISLNRIEYYTIEYYNYWKEPDVLHVSGFPFDFEGVSSTVRWWFSGLYMLFILT